MGVVMSRLESTWMLVIMAMFFSILIGVPLGITAAVHRNGLLDKNINSEAARLKTNVGVDGDGNVVRVDSQQNFSAEQGQGGTATRNADAGVKTGKGSEELNQALLNKKFNTFDL